MVTAYDVAARAEVSIGTVSRFLTGNGYVSENARRRIADAVAALGYIQNRAAASLTTKRTGLVGFVVSQLRNPFTADIAAALGEEARRHGYGVVLADSGGDPARSIEAVELLRSHDVDGLVVTPPESPEYNAALIAAARSVPIVGIGLRTDPMVTDIVTVDTATGARDAMTHLLDLGHRRIAFVGSSTMASGRYQAYCDSLTSRGIDLEDALVETGSLDRAAGHAALLRFMALDHPPTAVFAANDVAALGVMQGAHSLGIAVPEQLSVVGYDDVDLAALAVPPLTTVAQHTTALGEAAFGLLLARLTGTAPSDDPQQTILYSDLVIRESCAPPASL